MDDASLASTNPMVLSPSAAQLGFEGIAESPRLQRMSVPKGPKMRPVAGTDGGRSASESEAHQEEPSGPGLYLHWDGRKAYRTHMPAPRVWNQ